MKLVYTFSTPVYLRVYLNSRYTFISNLRFIIFFVEFLKHIVMMRLKFVVKDGKLVLRISEGKERFYRSTKTIITRTPNFSKHWNADKECFKCNFPGYKENNQALISFKENYARVIREHPELSTQQVVTYFESMRSKVKPTYDSANIPAEDYSNSVEKFLEKVIQREKVKPGCNFETYHKLLLKCRKILPDFPTLTFAEITYDKCAEIADTFAEHRGYYASTKVFRNMLGKAHKDRDVKFSISQIGDFSFRDYDPNKNEADLKKPDVLNSQQLKDFLNLNLPEITPEYSNRNDVRLYYDFSVFMFFSFMSPCDVIKLKIRDVTSSGTIKFKRKKTHKSVEVPISPVMEEIISRYKGMSKDGYIFPIQDDEKEKEYKTKDYFFKKFRERLNVWLKSLGKQLNLGFNLYAYVFRHTAITVALDGGLPISYISSVAGTDIDMIQKHYYNADNPKNQARLNMTFMKAAL